MKKLISPLVVIVLAVMISGLAGCCQFCKQEVIVELRNAEDCVTKPQPIYDKQWGSDVYVRDQAGGTPLKNVPVTITCDTYSDTKQSDASGHVHFGQVGAPTCPCVTTVTADHRTITAVFPANSCNNGAPKAVVVYGVLCGTSYDVNCK